jgi:hypothetical protein
MWCGVNRVSPRSSLRLESQTEAIYTNKEEATLKFLKKKEERGETLTVEQKAIVARFTLKSGSSSGNDMIGSLEKAVAASTTRPSALPSNVRAPQSLLSGKGLRFLGAPANFDVLAWLGSVPLRGDG